MGGFGYRIQQTSGETTFRRRKEDSNKPTQFCVVKQRALDINARVVEGPFTKSKCRQLVSLYRELYPVDNYHMRADDAL